MTADLKNIIETNGVKSDQSSHASDNIINGIAATIDHEVICENNPSAASKIDQALAKDIEAGDKVIEELMNKANGVKKSPLEITLEECRKKIVEVGDFSGVLEEVLNFLVKKVIALESNLGKETENRKNELNARSAAIEKSFVDENTKLKQIIKKENEERQKDMKDIEGFVKKENAERKKELTEVVDKIQLDELKRQQEARSMEDKIAREKRELEEYLKQDALDHKKQMEQENKAIKEKLDKEAADLKRKMDDADEEKAEEMKILQSRLDNERKILQEKMERERLELAEEMEKAEQDRKNEAAKLQNKLEEDRKEHESGIVKMFERLKGENENRKAEIHGLKDILVRENDRITLEQANLHATIAEGLVELDQKITRDLTACKSEIKKTVIDDLSETINNDKKELKNKMESDYGELKRRLEVESTELRDKMQFDKKGLMVKFEEVEDEMQKEAKLVR